jgi:hypothetical protein
MAFRLLGELLPLPQLISATRVVVVPSLFHSSLPILPSLAEKYNVEPMAVSLLGELLLLPELISATWLGELTCSTFDSSLNINASPCVALHQRTILIEASRLRATENNFELGVH